MNTAASAVGSGVVRPVSVEEFPAVLRSCLEDAGFPPSGTSSDGSLEYGPYNPTQAEDYESASAACRAQYPLDFDYARDATPEDHIRVYEHQRDVWVPCMEDNFGVNLGQMPSQESFLANQNWVAMDDFRAQLEQAVSEGRLDDLNAWVDTCPDYPQPSSDE